MLRSYANRVRKPWTLKVEQSYGCNLSCHFCPIDNLPAINQNKRWLGPDLCRTIAEQAVQLRPTFRVELTLRGEPTLNPHLLEDLRILRACGPLFQISLFTNGVKTYKDPSLCTALLDAGVNLLCIDCYNGTYERYKARAEETGETIVDFRTFSAYRRLRDGHKLRLINLVPDIQEGAVDVRKVHNNAGNVNPEYLAALPGYKHPVLPLAKRCARPFRELVVYCNGDVVLCCHDWQAMAVLGNVKDSDLSSIWYGEKHWRHLCDLYQKDRSRVPCDRCDYSGGYRLGLLQDPR